MPPTSKHSQRARIVAKRRKSAKSKKSKRAVSKKSKRAASKQQSRRKSGGRRRRGGGGGANNLTNEEVKEQMINVLKLKPGESTKFLWTTVYFASEKPLVKFRPFPEYKQDFNEACQNNIGFYYLFHILRTAQFGMFAVCNDGRNQAMVFADVDKHDANGLYIHLSCNKTKNSYGIRVAHLLKLAMLNYAKEQLGLKHAYNAAANLELVAFHAKSSGMTLRDKDCDADGDGDDDISRTFNSISNTQRKMNFTNSLVKNPNSKYKMDTSASYPMKLCNYNMEKMFEELLEHTMKKYNEGLQKGVQFLNCKKDDEPRLTMEQLLAH